MTDQEFMQKYRDLEGRIKQLEAVINKIKTDSEPELERATKDDYYYSIVLNDTCYVKKCLEQYCAIDDRCYNLLNYFLTNKRAQEVLDEIKFLLRLERLHDIYCPDYKPDWKANTMKYSVAYGASEAKWHPYNALSVKNAVTVYFPTEGIAQKVCDILNKEREDYDNS